MKLTILHLCDLHVSETCDLPSPERIAAVLREASENPDYVLIFLTGDIAFSGKGKQYEKVTIFLESLSKEVDGITSTKSSIVLLPGNHDCSFPEDSSVRDLVLDKVRSSCGKCDTEAYFRTCIDVQDEFFHWAEKTNCYPLRRMEKDSPGKLMCLQLKERT